MCWWDLLRPFTMENLWDIWNKRSKRSIDRFDRLWWVRLILYRGFWTGMSHQVLLEFPKMSFVTRVSVEVWTSEMSWTFACPAIGILRVTNNKTPNLGWFFYIQQDPRFLMVFKLPSLVPFFRIFGDGWYFMRFSLSPKFHDAILNPFFINPLISWDWPPMDFPYFFQWVVGQVMGLYPGDPGPPGADCSGTVLELGERVRHLRTASG